MKKITLSIILITLFTGLIKGQGVELTPFVGYQFGGSMKFIEGKLKIDDNLNYGLTMDIPLQGVASLEMYWSHMESQASWNPYSGYGILFPDTAMNMSVDYFQIGMLKQTDIGTGIVKGFGVFTLGATYFNVKETGIRDVWQFSITLGGGIKVFPFQSDRIGFRFQGRLLMPMYFGGTGAYCGIGTGGANCGVGVSTYSMLVQGDLTAGLIIKFGK